ncbi:MAG: glycosyltransferase family 61 protein, partial [Acidobacteriota bacterium]|nr:glycosyltransferase family 61 protein [Acidobacteriota bacterium]
IYGGRVIAYKSSIVFDPVYDVEYRNAEILPRFGMIRAGSLIVAESSHVKRNHWQNFTPGIIAMREGHALLCRRQPSPFAEATAYYFGNSTNYYHWLIEDMPRLLYLQDNHSAADGYFLVDHLLTGWQQDILLRLGSDPLRWRCVDFLEANKFPRLIAPSLYSKNLCAHPTAVAMLRSHLVADAADAMPRAGNRIYLARTSRQIRAGKLINEQEIIRVFEAAGFVTVDTGSLTFAQQIDLFRDAEIIAGPGGAALTNMIFAPPGAKVLVLAPSGAQCETFVSIAGAIGQDIITCLGDSRPSPHPIWINTTFDFSIQLADVRLALDVLTG